MYRIGCSVVSKIIFYSEFLNILGKAGRKTTTRRRTQAIVERYAFHANAINDLFNCNEKFLVYLLTCPVCLKQYVGQTVDEFQNTWNNYKSNDIKCLNRQSCLHEHFNVDSHSGSLENNSITFFDKTDPSDKARKLLDSNSS